MAFTSTLFHVISVRKSSPMARASDRPLEDIQGFVDTVVSEMDNLPDLLANEPESPLQIDTHG
jgi:hypothetical protein